MKSEVVKNKISIISPVYAAEGIVSELVTRIDAVLKKNNPDFEIILVEDGSPDKSWEEIEQCARMNPALKGIKLSRNFGQHYAITAGLENATGEWIIVMDCDLQDVPEEIPKLIDKAHEGYDIVQGLRQNRNDKWSKKLFSYLFYNFLSWLTGLNYDHRIANFGIYHRKVISSILDMGDSIRYFPSMVKWVGFNSTVLKVVHNERSEGNSSYNFRKLFNLALDIILSYSDKPIRIVIKTGMIISFLALVAIIITLIQFYLGIITVPGYSSIIISIWFFSGLIIAFMGIIGLYVSKTFEAARRRPVYIISKQTK